MTAACKPGVLLTTGQCERTQGRRCRDAVNSAQKQVDVRGGWSRPSGILGYLLVGYLGYGRAVLLDLPMSRNGIYHNIHLYLVPGSEISNTH